MFPIIVTIVLLTATGNAFRTSNYRVDQNSTAVFVDPLNGCDSEVTLINASYGTIKSRLDLDGRYYANRSCSWLIVVSPHKIVSFRFKHLDLEACALPGLQLTNTICTCDYVSIQNGNTNTSPLITKQCGKKVPNEAFTTSDNQALVTFSTDESHEWRGFSLDFKALDGDNIPCRVVNVISGRKSGIIKNYACAHTNAYRPNEDCKWRIIATANHVIRFTLLFHDIQECNHCNCDSISIYDGPSGSPSNNYPKLITKKCGFDNGTNSTYVTAGNFAFVHFKTGATVNGTGFILHYQEEAIEDNTPCTHTTKSIANGSGIIQSYKRSLDGKYRSREECGWMIQAPDSDMFIRLRILYLDIEQCSNHYASCSCDSVSIYSGLARSRLDTVCGTDWNPNNLVYIARSVMFVHFSTDENGERTGFRAFYEMIQPDDVPCANLTIIYLENGNGYSVKSPLRRTGVYRPNESCDWKLSGPKGMALMLEMKFVDFDGQCNLGECGCDFVEIYDGDHPSPERLKATVCGKVNCTGNLYTQQQEICKVFKTTQEFAFIRLRTDSKPYKMGAGFQLEAMATAQGDRQARTHSEDNTPGAYDSTVIVAAVATLVCIVSFAIIAAIYCKKFRKNSSDQTVSSSLQISSPNLERYITLANNFRSVVAEHGNDQMGVMIERLHIDSKCVTIKNHIGEGHFGVVYSGTLKQSEGRSEEEVAVKVVKSGSSENVIAFLKEALIMQNMEHPNVLRLLGICVVDDQPFMIFPFMKNGSLRAYIREHKEEIAGITLSHFCLQICRGMVYLSKQKCAHRDLAARNVLVSSEGVLKIADFGLARDLQDAKSYYWSSANPRPLPVRWHPPESIIQRTFEEKSDVWSFGVVCWEIFTKCLTEPYSGMTNEEVIDYVCRQNQRLSKPDHCPDEMYREIMLKCWLTSRSERPAFSELLPVLKSYNMAILETSSQ